MKRTFLAMLMAGSSMAMFAQTTPTTPSTPTTSPTTPTSTSPTTNSTTDPLNTTTNSQSNSNTNSGNWNSTTNSAVNPNGTTAPYGTNPSTSWEPGTSPSWGWNSYGIWNNGGTSNNSMNGGTYNGTTSVNGTTSTDMNASNMNTDLSSTGSYNAYGTAVTALPPNVGYRFSQDFPSSMNSSYSWNQYDDWFHTQYRANGRSMHYFYSQRGDGYALALPVIQTYVPEDIIDKALNKYGSSLYSIGMVKAVDSGNTYQIGLIERGQLRMEYLNDEGASVANIWRTEEDMNTAGSLNSTDANAAMDSDMSSSTSDMNISSDANASESKETKVKWKENGVKTKIKSEDGKLKIKQKKVDD